MRLAYGLLLAALLTAQPQPEAASISGKVIHSLTGAPVRKATVRLTSDIIGLNAITDAEGAFHFTALPVGIYSLFASSPGFIDTRLHPFIRLGKEESLTSALIRLKPAAALSGRVLDEDGDPLGNAQIFLFREKFDAGRARFKLINLMAQANAQGEYSIEGLSPGRYLIQASSSRPAPNHQFAYARTFFPNSPKQDSATPVVLTPGVKLSALEIRVALLPIPKHISISGRISGVPADTQPVISVSTQSGSSTTAHPPGYSFQLTAPSGTVEFFANVYSGPGELFAHDTLNLNSDTSDILLALSPAARLSAEILPTPHDPSADLTSFRFSLQSLTKDFVASSERSDQKGHFSFDKAVPPGRYLLYLDPNSLPAGYLLDKLTLAGQPVAPEGFEVTTSATLRLTLSKTAATLTALVQARESKPQPGVLVTLYALEASLPPRRAITGDDGTTTFNALPPGKYLLIPSTDLDEDLWQDPNYYKRFPTQSTEVTLAPAQQTSTTLLLPTDH